MRMPRCTMLVAVVVVFLLLAAISLSVKMRKTSPEAPRVNQTVCKNVAEFMCEYYKWPERTQYADPSVGVFQYLNSKGVQYATKEPPPEKYSSRGDIAFYLLLPAHLASDRPELIAYAVLTRNVDKSKQTCRAFFLRDEEIVTVMIEIRVLDRILGKRSDATIEPDFYIWPKLAEYKYDLTRKTRLDSYKGEKHGKES